MKSLAGTRMWWNNHLKNWTCGNISFNLPWLLLKQIGHHWHLGSNTFKKSSTFIIQWTIRTHIYILYIYIYTHIRFVLPFDARVPISLSQFWWYINYALIFSITWSTGFTLLFFGVPSALLSNRKLGNENRQESHEVRRSCKRNGDELRTQPNWKVSKTGRSQRCFQLNNIPSLFTRWLSPHEPKMSPFPGLSRHRSGLWGQWFLDAGLPRMAFGWTVLGHLFGLGPNWENIGKIEMNKRSESDIFTYRRHELG